MVLSNSRSLILAADERQGQSALSTILVIGGIIMLFAISIALITLSLVNSTSGAAASNKAAALAAGGLRDAELQLMRNSSFSDTVGYCVPAANTPCPATSTLVIVTQNSPTTGQVTVTSDATVQRRRRKLSAVYYVSATTSLIVPVTQTTLTQ